MSLTQDQVQQVLKAMTASSLDKKLIEDVKDILELHGGNGALPNTTYDSIKGFCQNYVSSLEEMDRGLVPENYEDEMMVVYMDKTAVSSVLSNVPDGGFLAGIMGVYDNTSSEAQLTISLLATDRDLNFVKDARGNYLAGEQCWKQISVVENFDTVFK